MTKTLQIEYDENLLKLLQLSPAEFDQEARFLIAAKLYEMQRLSSGHAAKLCGMGRVNFLLKLAENGIPASNLRPEDLDLETPLGEP